MVKVSRHEQRIWALQILYGLDLLNEMKEDRAERFFREYKRRNDLGDEKYYFEGVVKGVLEKKDEIDDIISQKAIDWKLDRMAYVDRNILRIALFEMMNQLPFGVAINEAVELAKEFGDEKSSSFINGILAEIDNLQL